MAGFVFFDSFSRKFDAATAAFATDITGNLIATLTPVITVGLTLGFLVYAFGIIRGVIDHPMPDFLWRCFRIGVIVSIATAGGLYQTQIADAIMTTPDALAKALVSGPSAGDTAGSIYDAAAQKAFDVAAKAWEKAGWFGAEGLMYLAFAVLYLLAAVVIFGIGVGLIIIAKVALAVLAALGPLFIFALLWQPTAKLFEQWISQVLNYGFVIILTTIIFMLIIDVFGNYSGGVNINGSQNMIYTLAAALLISLASIMLLLQVPSIASGLAGGVGLGYMYELRMMRSGAGAAGRAGKTAGVVAGQAGKSTVRSVMKMANYARGKLGG